MPARDEVDFFAPEAMYHVNVEGWPTRLTLDALFEEVPAGKAEIVVHRTEPASREHCPEAGGDEVLLRQRGEFTMRMSGNMTRGTPKASYKIELDGDAKLAGMKTINLKSMWNDASQMRESLAWTLFREAGVHAPRHTYAKFCVNGRYVGLFSVIEQVEGALLRRAWGKKRDEGNLYKGYWADVGPADLSWRGDRGSDYFASKTMHRRTYQLKTKRKGDEAALASYDDLATFARVLSGRATGGDVRSEAYRRAVEKIFDVRGFLRWASLNLLLGAWDNYWRTPGNFYLYNGGRSADEEALLREPYFVWIPWDYDNTFGMDFSGTAWHYADLVDWEKTANARRARGEERTRAPLVTNLLQNAEYLRYYLDHLEHLLDACFRERWIVSRIGTEDGDGLWERCHHAAYLEADTPEGPTHTGRQFTNHEVYQHGFLHHELVRGSMRAEGILHYVRMRHDSAREQLASLRKEHPRGASGAQFPEAPAPLPE